MFNRYPITGVLIVVSILSFLSLSSSTTSADVTSDIAVAVPVSCNMTSELDTAHTATINAGQYQSDIGTTNFKVVCNDNSGYAIYAIGYSNEEYGNTKMLATINNSLNPTYDINTGTNTSGANSSWSMKLIPVTTASSGTTQPYTPTIESDTNGSFANYHVVPETYTKVATFASSTDATIGSNLQSTYQAYIDGTKPAGTYTGKVKYTLVHPSDIAITDAFPSMLDTGKNVNQKLKRLAGNSSATYYTENETITALIRSDSLPNNFTPSDDNIISTSSSLYPIYAWYDSANTSIYYYSETDNILMNSNSSYFFYEMYNLSDLSTISGWDASNVMNMSYMFYDLGINTSSFVLDLSSWDTSSVTDMSEMFSFAGYGANTFTLNLSSWDTSNVTNMFCMFHQVGSEAKSFDLNVSSWDTSKVTNMSNMFQYAGENADDFALDLSSWNTSSVTDMSSMFSNAGNHAGSFSLNLSSWNTSSVTNMNGMFSSAGGNADSFALDLSSWDTSSVTDMGWMFANAGYFAADFTLNLSSWDTSSVTRMNDMFMGAGSFATTWSVTIPQTNGNNISNTTNRIYGQDTSVYGEPDDGKSFTIAQQ